MVRIEKQFVKPLSGKEVVEINGGSEFAPPTEEQLEELRKKYGPLADIIVW